MLRKLFISLLILSALTSEGIINLTEILYDPSILTKEVIDIVLGYEGEFTAKKIECLNKKHEVRASSALFSSIKFSNGSYKSYSEKTNIKSWLAANNKAIELVVLLPFSFLIVIVALRILKKDIIFYHSDLSPPLCYN